MTEVLLHRHSRGDSKFVVCGRESRSDLLLVRCLFLLVWILVLLFGKSFERTGLCWCFDLYFVNRVMLSPMKISLSYWVSGLFLDNCVHFFLLFSTSVYFFCYVLIVFYPNINSDQIKITKWSHIQRCNANNFHQLFWYFLSFFLKVCAIELNPHWIQSEAQRLIVRLHFVLWESVCVNVTSYKELD